MNSLKGEGVFFGTDQRTVPGAGSEVLLPISAGKIDTIMVTLILTSGSGYVQASISERAPRNWITWDAGTVTKTTSDVFYGVKAVRLVNVTGTVGLEVRAL